MIKVGDIIEYYGDKIEILRIDKAPKPYEYFCLYGGRVLDKKQRKHYKVDDEDTGEFMILDTHSLEHSEEIKQSDKQKISQ